MGWRNDFKDALIDVLRGISGIGSIVDEYTQTPTDLPALIISLGEEEYDHGIGVKIVTLPFKILAKVSESKDISQKKEELADAIIEKINGINTYYIFLETTDPLSEVEGGGDVFIISGYALVEKDFSSM